MTHQPAPDRVEHESLSSGTERRKRFVGRNKRTIIAWQNYFCIQTPASGNRLHMPNVPFPRKSALFIAVATVLASPVQAQRKSISPPPPPPIFADMADLIVQAPLVIDASVHESVRIKGPEAANVAPGRVRLYLTVDINALIRGTEGLPPQIGFTYDAPVDAAGRPPKLKKTRVLLFARPVAGMSGQVQLVTPDAEIPWSPAADAMTRQIAREASAPKAMSAITGITNAFHAAGTLPGEGETQIFLTTRGGPVSLGIVRKQDQPPVWTIALNEVVEQALPAPRRDTFLWYRLACGLPGMVPQAVLSGLDPSDAQAIVADYTLVKRDLGPCRPAGAAPIGGGAPG